MKAAIIVLLASVSTAAADTPTCKPQSYGDTWPYLDAPSDPWMAVERGKPRKGAIAKDGTGRTDTTKPRAACDAAHDHCFRDCTWLVVDSDSPRRAAIEHVDEKGQFVLANHRGAQIDGYTAYRTIPVTKQNLKVGSLAFALIAANGAQPLPMHPYDTSWDMGLVESIEWDRGWVRFEGRDDPYYLSSTRLAVLVYKDGGKVEAVPGTTAKAPAIAEVILPAKKPPPSDPWSAVGKTKQPIAVDDKTPMSATDQACDGSNDHCLRPWVWFVDVGHDPVPARWDGKKFFYAEDPNRAIDKPGLAYRTRPAKETEIVVGAKILVYDSTARIESEALAHGRKAWTFATVEKIDRLDHTMFVKGSSGRLPFDHARILVLYWLAGEEAAKVE